MNDDYLIANGTIQRAADGGNANVQPSHKNQLCGIAIGVMMSLGCLHPPGGAVALTAVLGGPSIQATGYGFAIWPIAVSSLLLLGAAFVFNHLMSRVAKLG